MGGRNITMRRLIVPLSGLILTALMVAGCNVMNTSTNNASITDDTTSSRATYSLDNTTHIATDLESRLIWQNGQIGHGDRTAARARCDALEFGGLTGWRLPRTAESRQFHRKMNAEGNTPVQAFTRCTAEVTEDGYVRTKRGAERYGGTPGDPINFRGRANIRCVHDPISTR